ncbi:unnamed protein product [Lampetra planeri]
MHVSRSPQCHHARVQPAWCARPWQGSATRGRYRTDAHGSARGPAATVTRAAKAAAVPKRRLRRLGAKAAVAAAPS